MTFLRVSSNGVSDPAKHLVVIEKEKRRLPDHGTLQEIQEIAGPDILQARRQPVRAELPCRMVHGRCAKERCRAEEEGRLQVRQPCEDG